ncbi:MAG: hypothetical protein LBC18_05500 [Opitutaceae bacterium]|jgi:hypothetical protein|nr:hypothetical protein [Opitutaceae bacterium]
MDKEILIQKIKEGLEDAELGINQHPQQTIDVYKNGRNGFRNGQSKTDHPEWAKEMSISMDELKLISDYLFAMAFISAWFHVHRERGQRDKTVQTATLLVSGLGLDPEKVMQRMLSYEFAWRENLNAIGIGKRNYIGCLLVFLIISSGIGYAVYAWISK